jgi:hypothetical protein
MRTDRAREIKRACETQTPPHYCYDTIEYKYALEVLKEGGD